MKIPKPRDPEDESAWRAFFRACERHHESLRGRVPKHALALLNLEGVDDGLLVEADYNRAERTLKNGRRNALDRWRVLRHRGGTAMHRGQTWMWIVMLGMWLAILAALAGCGGATSHQIITDYKGSLQGMVVAPPNGARDVDTRVKPRIAWRGDAQPPAVFSVSLKYQRQGGDFDPVRTRVERLSEKEWQLVPTFPLSSGTLHAIVVTAPNERVESWFITEGDPIYFRSAPPTEPAADADDGAAFEHTIYYHPLPK